MQMLLYGIRSLFPHAVNFLCKIIKMYCGLIQQAPQHHRAICFSAYSGMRRDLEKDKISGLRKGILIGQKRKGKE